MCLQCVCSLGEEAANIGCEPGLSWGAQLVSCLCSALGSVCKASAQHTPRGVWPAPAKMLPRPCFGLL